MSAKAAPLPDGIHVEGFKFTQQGTAMGPYYSVRKTDDGYECATTLAEVLWPEIDGEEYYPADKDPFDGYRASRVILSADDLAELERIVNDHGVYGWNGYDESYSPPAGVLDMDDSFTLKVLLSDGSIITAHGYNSEPEGFSPFALDVIAFFEAHQDYSAYYPTTLPDAQATSLAINIGDTFYTKVRTQYSIELNRSWGRWIINVSDPRGEILADQAEISDYGDVDGELPFDTFLSLIRKYDLESWNGTETIDSALGSEACEIRITFDNGQEYYVHTNVYPDNYEAFRNEVAHAIVDYYETVKA